MKLIASTTLSATATTIQFNSIPQTFTDLVLVGSIRTGVGAVRQDINVVCNADFGNQQARLILGVASGGVGSFTPGFNQAFLATGANATTNTFSNFTLYCTNYTSSATKLFSKDSVAESNLTDTGQMFGGGAYNITNPINRVWFYAGEQLFQIGSTVSLYGILKGSDGITTAS